jgi:hypothetical protein
MLRSCVPKSKLPFTQSDVKRAASGAIKAGLAVRRVEIDRSGKIVIFIGGDEPIDQQFNEWDGVR